MANNNFLDFNRGLPAPFNTVDRRVKGVTSTYSGSVTYATLSVTVVKAALAYVGIQRCTTRGGVGFIDGHTSVAEYKSSVDHEWHIVVYDNAKGSVRAAVYNDETDRCAPYTVNAKNRDGAAVVLAMMPFLMKDKEFADAFGAFDQHNLLGGSPLDEYVRDAALLCDNTYRRIKDDTLPCALKHNIDKAGNILQIGMAEIESGMLTPANLVAGEFVIFTNGSGATGGKPAKKMVLADFIGKHPLPKTAVLTDTEKALVPILGDWFVVPDEAVKICRAVVKTSQNNIPMRNFLLRGPAGTGKTSIAKAVAAGLGVPYYTLTCSADMEIFDFIGQIIPRLTKPAASGTLAAVERLGGVTIENIAEVLGLPSMDDVEFDPVTSFEALTGNAKADATMQDCMAAYHRIVAEKYEQILREKFSASDGSAQYEYQYTDFLNVIQNGGVIEIQEPTVIVRPGVLVGLNSLLEQGGTIRLPDGSVIKRHPDAVVIITTNTSYEGCRGLNQSVIDRMNMTLDVDVPDDDTLAERVMNITGETDVALVEKMLRVMHAVEDFCKKSSITDGITGPRTLFDWVQLNGVLDDPYEAALSTIIAKATSDADDRAAIVGTCLDPIFSRQ